MPPHAIKCPTRGGARPHSGRPNLHRRSVSARVDDALYTVLRQTATKQGIAVSVLVEEALKEKFGGKS
jgi:hypothetical protein